MLNLSILVFRNHFGNLFQRFWIRNSWWEGYVECFAILIFSRGHLRWPTDSYPLAFYQLVFIYNNWEDSHSLQNILMYSWTYLKVFIFAAIIFYHIGKWVGYSDYAKPLNSCFYKPFWKFVSEILFERILMKGSVECFAILIFSRATEGGPNIHIL